MRFAKSSGYFCDRVFVNRLRDISFVVDPAIFLNAATAFLYTSSVTAPHQPHTASTRVNPPPQLAFAAVVLCTTNRHMCRKTSCTALRRLYARPSLPMHPLRVVSSSSSAFAHSRLSKIFSIFLILNCPSVPLRAFQASQVPPTKHIIVHKVRVCHIFTCPRLCCCRLISVFGLCLGETPSCHCCCCCSCCCSCLCCSALRLAANARVMSDSQL